MKNENALEQEGVTNSAFGADLNDERRFYALNVMA